MAWSGTEAHASRPREDKLAEAQIACQPSSSSTGQGPTPSLLPPSPSPPPSTVCVVFYWAVLHLHRLLCYRSLEDGAVH